MADVTTQVKTSLNSLMNEFTAITHNLANVSTSGYKRNCGMFSEQLSALLNDGEVSEDVTGLNSAYDFSQGSLNQTGGKLDLALYGDGFFKIETPDGALYTRNGMFNLNQNGEVVDTQGRMVSGENGAIILPTGTTVSDLSVSSDGTISDGATTLGKLKIVDLGEAKDTLVPVGMNCFKTSEDVRETDAENVVVKQGYLETSNVKVVEELVNMITVSRLYQANMKILSKKSENGKKLMSLAMGG